MAEVYRIWVKYSRVSINSLVTPFPGDFDSGEHGVLWLQIDEQRWFTRDDGTSGPLAVRYFGAASGTLRSGGGNVVMYANGKQVGVFDVAVLKTTNLQGVIGTKFKTGPAIIPGTGAQLFTEGLFSRPPVWADKSDVEKFTELLSSRRKYADGEVGTLISNLLHAIPWVMGIILLLAGLGVAAGPAVAGVVALCVAVGGYFVPRGMEYADKLKVVGEVMRTSSPHESELDQGARALAEFFRLVLEDLAFALAAKAGETAVVKIKARKAEAVEPLDQAFTRHKKEEFDRAAKRAEKQKAAPKPAADYTAEQIELARSHAFNDMPSLKNRNYSEIKRWLIDHGFVWQKKEIMDKKGMNSNAGGSEIFVRRSPELERAREREVVRIDKAGHQVYFKDAPLRVQIKQTKNGGYTDVTTRGAGGFRHMHKDVVPVANLRAYTEQFVLKIRSFNDFNNMIDPASKTSFQDAHIQIKAD